MLHRTIAPVVAAMVIAVSSGLVQGQGGESQPIEKIRSALTRLPYYGVFDFLAFRYDKGTVTLSGYAYQSRLKQDAASAVRRLPGVDQVENQIEELSVAPHDEDIRWAAFYAIYDDASLSRYSPGGARFGYERRFQMVRFPGMQPVGMYPIHIIVNRGRILLAGAVDSEVDKRLAEVRVRTIPQIFGVENALSVIR